ncbi:hypothetical protein PoB_007394000 [Plakobranchus ocellatus]|uniref:Uncharacterized protein n=1 Tax=Plakobranchus ocellatus TaxID=259542 RepID=A0AAV4DTY0_9GAST|nr:hypothetical protein PoB_007394000 [Plakobranchus ocellatus]
MANGACMPYAKNSNARCNIGLLEERVRAWWIITMTTVGVDPEKPRPLDTMRMPDYNYHYRALKNKQQRDNVATCTLAYIPHPQFRRVTEERRRQ